jgi:intracellular protein transport protein USO1
MISLVYRKLQQTLALKEDEYKKQVERTRLMVTEEQRKQVEQAKRLAEAETERFQRRTEAEVADLRATISRLEVDLMRVRQ